MTNVSKEKVKFDYLRFADIDCNDFEVNHHT